ncbi:MAG: hypothetical protein KC729_17005, partial [Candidatus Eisenbacteria bacterium]|nr:hypothetical protein [Candidatus Eisenbacteria bacterium]
DALVERARSLAKGIEFYKSPVPPEAVSWKQKLDGCRLSYFSRYNSGGGGGGYTTQTTIDLCAEGYFKWNLEDETVWNADPGGVTGGYSMQHGKGNGTWKIVGRGGSAALLLTFHDGSTREYVLSTNDQGQTFLDGDRYLRTCDPNDGVVEARPQCP